MAGGHATENCLCRFGVGLDGDTEMMDCVDEDGALNLVQHNIRNIPLPTTTASNRGIPLPANTASSRNIPLPATTASNRGSGAGGSSMNGVSNGSDRHYSDTEEVMMENDDSVTGEPHLSSYI